MSDVKATHGYVGVCEQHCDVVAALRARVGEMRDDIQAKSDNAYCRGLDVSRTTPCLGWEAKVKSGEFGRDELEAHKLAAHWDGKHRAYADVLDALRAGERGETR